MIKPIPARTFRHLLLAALTCAAAGLGCKTSPEGNKAPIAAKSTDATTATQAATPQPDAAAQPEAAAPKAVDASPSKAVSPDAGAEVGAGAEANAAPVKPYDRKTLETAYLEISCIQKKGEAAKLLAAYKKYGFSDPRAWIKAWESQKKTPDYEQWLATLTQRAWKACP